ncbi:putative bifunctional diguanylate cyclase/phosphodiesterase [Marinimicrobium alkaliphilum]|uniref:putative bifunctional diguanylate cyclase/phosphodiesterase n=1 Tax=Marinimicrobium alkaliphilum TaxID=2202654 RepID=UPI000DB9051D|nr:GGDEF domain-containing protein [Marinimicrobium alkaliphilum]
MGRRYRVKSYLVKLLLWMLALVLLLEASSYLTTRVAIRDAVTANARAELARGGEVFSRLMDARAEQLALSVTVLTDDFGFKEAVASNDAPTIRSALINHAARIQADLALVADNQGVLVASTLEAPSEALDGIIARGDATGTRYDTVIINQRPYQFVVSPVRAPVRIGTAGLGFEIEDSLSESLKRLTGLEVAFVATGDAPRYLSGTLDQDERQALLEHLAAGAPEFGEPFINREMMTLRVPIAAAPDSLEAVLQVPLAEVLAPYSALDRQLLWITLGFSLFAALLAWLLAGTVTRPLRTLAAAARRMAAGDYDTPVQIESRDEMGQLAQGFTRMQRAIAEREREITFRAQHDALTGLYNRAQLTPLLEAELADASTGGVLLVDIENFTALNDALSPEMGDQILVAVAQRLKALAGTGERVVRMGSDEFALLLTAADVDDEAALANRLRGLFLAPLAIGELRVNVEVKAGLVHYPADGQAPDALLRRANLALQAADARRCPICRYQSGWDERHARRLMVFREFREALADGQMQLYYQPKISLAPPPIVAAEALVRWIHPREGFINPDDFIGTAESTGQITLLTRWVIDEAVGLLARVPALHLSVNLSAMDLLESDFVDDVRATLARHQVAPERLTLEVTESALMVDPTQSLATLHQLKALGTPLSIDDFGTGFSSLSQLKKMPVSELKIDKSFVLQLDSSDDDQRIVRSTIDLAHTLGLTTTAEGVENAGAEALLRQWGCERVQGFYYARPQPEADFLQWLQDHSGQEK